MKISERLAVSCSVMQTRNFCKNIFGHLDFGMPSPDLCDSDEPTGNSISEDTQIKPSADGGTESVDKPSTALPKPR